MNTPRVSIIIPIFKTEKYLRDCLLSVQRQTMPDFEAILVNDCTPDNSMQIANEFVRNDSRFYIIEHKENLGLGCARNTGIALAQGEYLNFLDSDDKLPSDAIQVLFDLADTHNVDMVIGNMAWIIDHHLSSVKYIDDRIRLWSTFRSSNLRNLPDVYSFIGSVCNRLIKNKIIQEQNIVFPEDVYFEDLPFTLKIWFYSKSIFYSSHYIYFRTQRHDIENLSLTQIYNEKAFYDRDVVAQYIFNFAKQYTDAGKLGAITLNNMLYTAKTMLASADECIKKNMIDSWYPQHSRNIINMIDELNQLIPKDEP